MIKQLKRNPVSCGVPLGMFVLLIGTIVGIFYWWSAPLIDATRKIDRTFDYGMSLTSDEWRTVYEDSEILFSNAVENAIDSIPPKDFPDSIKKFGFSSNAEVDPFGFTISMGGGGFVERGVTFSYNNRDSESGYILIFNGFITYPPQPE